MNEQFFKMQEELAELKRKCSYQEHTIDMISQHNQMLLAEGHNLKRDYDKITSQNISLKTQLLAYQCTIKETPTQKQDL